MKTINKFLVIVMVFLTIGITVVACSSSKKTLTENNIPVVAGVEEEFKLEKSGAQLWGETCNRCHLAPSPADYNDTDWETISLHMRVRANLTENDVAKIEEFLKSAN
ncbi:hypothetical protein C21_02766 [Arenibacter sp. NBRC 103722]|uniref:Cytochrome c n=1 Tax=Arenibacter echinorum TaxID=440515 RepID=A0A327R209_9FLAO|nr:MULTISPECIES: hypothetical protein [Arenibacter]MCK0191956.1 hypothetical protein [Arenibacter sp. F20364]RAJ10295.1 hypothetical protein LV92_03044 [Arenibacter echinorum]GBF20593.1 hypothetical protein C21_02766 [Arenibacter sp. NBRC 103722]